MSRLPRILWFAMLPALLASQPLDPEEVLDGVTARVEQNLQQLPDYACALTIERYWKIRRRRRFQPMDTLRLEVGYIEGVEMYAFPGEGRFDGEIPALVAASGMFSTGNFAAHLRKVFLSGAARFDYRGSEKLAGRLCHRYWYRVPAESNLYRLHINGTAANVGYHGEIWINAETLDIARTAVVLEDVPKSMNIRSAEETVDYRRVSMEGGQLLLPAEAKMVLVAGNASATRNELRYSGCRQFQGESAISFLAPGEQPAIEKAAPARIQSAVVPAGLVIELVLDKPIDLNHAFVGDEITAFVRDTVSHLGEVVVPEGARARGRLLHLQRVTGLRGVFTLVLEFDVIEMESMRMELHGDVLTFDPKLQWGLELIGPQDRRVQNVGPIIIGGQPSVNAATAKISHGQTHIPKGTAVVWRSF